ncbi:hypothetical protein [Microbacterium pseudoresistens]|uniref:Uncharacterized protein n=1 Tax=Microbacterium pseudoresistens TaxID=640634 RepID=A0A7Y9EU69_9MICO|nr:hypothetical protein [Microbacterium pseudoresistens]NYD53884.1 hypothetical protein [Microbacterium pseudoresistens]
MDKIIEPLLWFPKQFQAGDMDGTGGDRLLGRTDLSPLEVLIRETAQNSWDARVDGSHPLYGAHLRRVDFRLRADLDRLFATGRQRSGRHRVPSVNNLHVLEVFDRGTSGLDGPTDLSPTSPGEPCNFQDLILKVGVPRDDGKGGGTYGFGKTAAYAFSAQGTVLFWSRCRDGRDGLEYRLVVSAFHESYVSEGKQFTGRHWWGAGEDGLVAPLIGDVAQAYGERFFARHFEGDETGTSLLILDPLISVPRNGEFDEPDSAELRNGDPTTLEHEFAREARRAMRLHLWPKLIVAPGHARPPMPLELRVHEQNVDLVGDTPGALASWGAGLNAIRSRVRDDEAPVIAPSGLPVEVHAVVRNRKTIGHLAVVKRLKALEARLDEDDLDPVWDDDSVQRIAMMRDQAELVVATDDWSDHTASPIFDWVAVFKSAREWDRTFADAEPPAHDMWVSSAGGETGLVIRAMRNKVRAILRETFVVPEPADVAHPGASARRGVGTVARMLGMLLPSKPEEKPSSKPRTPPAAGRRSSRRQLISVEAPRLVRTFSDGRQQQQIGFLVDGEGEFIVDVAVSVVGDDGARMRLPANDLLSVWDRASDLGGGKARAKGNLAQTVTVVGPSRRALLIEMNASVDNAS